MKHVVNRRDVRQLIRCLTLVGLVFVISLAATGCTTVNIAGQDVPWPNSTKGFEPQNFHQSSAWLPNDLRRVAVLPLTTTDDGIAESTREQLEQLLPLELTRTGLFEVVPVSPAQLRRWTGRSRWAVTDALPPDLFRILQEQLGCDGVVFSHLTACRPYPPMVMGWKLHLADARQPQIWWACDLLYDAGDQTVAHSAVSYERQHQSSRLPAADPATILRSPGRFGQYTLAASLGTLQRHEKNH